jgi:hypothetical protein
MEKSYTNAIAQRQPKTRLGPRFLITIRELAEDQGLTQNLA